MSIYVTQSRFVPPSVASLKTNSKAPGSATLNELRGVSNTSNTSPPQVWAAVRKVFTRLESNIRHALVGVRQDKPAPLVQSKGGKPSSEAAGASSLQIRCDIQHAYRLDGRSPAELLSGFGAYADSAMGPLATVLPNGSAFCAGECLNSSIPKGKQLISPSQAAQNLKDVALFPGAALHIYHLDLEGVPVARYLDNVTVSTQGAKDAPAHYAGTGPFNILRTPTNMDLADADSDIEYTTIGGKAYDFPSRANVRAQVGELYVLETVQRSKLLYGGTAAAPLKDWVPLEP